MHLGFNNQDCKEFKEFEVGYEQVKSKLIPLVKYYLN
jgi:hypothetical protein